MAAVDTKHRSIIVTVAKLAALILISTQVAAQSVVENIKPVGQVCLIDQSCVGALIDDASTPIMSTSGVTITKLAHGVPMGGELDYLDDGTLGAALYARRPV